MRKTYLLITALLAFLLFASQASLQAATTYTWVDKTKIEGGGITFNLYNGTEGSSDYTPDRYMPFRSEATVPAPLNTKAYIYIYVDKSNPSLGIYKSPWDTSGRQQTVTIANATAGPTPVRFISRGAIWGKVFPYPSAADWVSDVNTYITKEKIILKYDDPFTGRVTDIDERGIEKDSSGDGYHYNKMTIGDPGFNKGKPLPEGRYRLYYRHGEGGDCSSGNAAGNSAGDAIIGCETIFYGIVNFDLIYIDGTSYAGAGQIKLVGNETENEKASPADTKTTLDVTYYDKGINIDIVEEQQNTFTEALKNATIEMLKMINFGIETGTGWINGILNEGNDIESSLGVADIWKTTRNMALGLLTFAIILIAFANILSLDLGNYGLSRILPKMIIAIVLTYFSYFIAVFLLDMMSAFQALLFNAAGATSFDLAASTEKVLSPDALDNVSAIFELVFLALLGVGLFLAVMWLCIVLIVRNAMLFVIIAVAPIAFMANILPFTETYYKKWWGEFWKWAFIGPAVAFMLWLSQAFLSGYLTAKYSGLDPQTPSSWVFLIGAAVLIFMSATIPLKLGGEIMKKTTQPITNTGKNAYKRSGVPGALEQRKANADARAKARSQAMLGSLGTRKTTGFGGFVGRKLSGTDKAQQQALRLQTIKGMGEALPEDSAALTSIINSTSGLKKEAALFKAASTGKLNAEDGATREAIMTYADKNNERYIQEFEKTVGKENPDFMAAAAVQHGVAKNSEHFFTKGATAGLSKTPISDYTSKHWDFENTRSNGETFRQMAKQKSSIDAALKGKPESSKSFAEHMVKSGAAAHVEDDAQYKEIYAKAGVAAPTRATQNTTPSAPVAPAISTTQNTPTPQPPTPAGLNPDGYEQTKSGLWIPKK